MSVDCGLAQNMLKKFGDLEKRVTYLEEKSRGQQDLIEKLRTKLKKLKKITKNKGKLNQEKPAGAKPKPKLIEKIESTQNGSFKTLKKDPKINLKLVIRMGIRCDEETQEILNNVEKTVENGHSIKISQIKSECTQNDAKRVEISSKLKRSVKKSHICNFCSKSFPYFSDLSRHMRVHTGERPFKCKICLKSFKEMEVLKRHTRTHTGEKPFSCSVCSRTFSLAANLKRHIMIHTGEKPYSCSFCAKSFSQNDHRNNHIRSHLGERPYSCSVCSKSFTKSSSLFQHRNIHASEKPYSCSICAKKFSTSGNMKRHEITHKFK